MDHDREVDVLNNLSFRYVVKFHLLGVVFHNTFWYRKLAYAHVLNFLMYTSGWCTVDKEEFKDGKWTMTGRWIYDKS